MLNIRYNSWLDRYKSPFGAVQKDQQLKIGIQVAAKNVATVELLVHEDGQTASIDHVLEKTAGDFYQTTLTLDQAGLYFYYFKITLQINSQPQVYFYGETDDRFGGVGQISAAHDLKAYQLTCYNKKVTAPAWYKSGVFYQIFPDRFFNGNPDGKLCAHRKNTFIYGTTEDTPLYVKDHTGSVIRWDFFGGNLRGIIAKIPYLKNLGITGIYLNPIFFANSSHRYDTNDYFRIDPMLGTEEDFRELVEKLHQAGICVILDGVFNHVGKDSKYFNARCLYYDKQTGAAQQKNSPYYSWFEFKHYPDDYAAWWGVKDLPKVDKNNPAFQKMIYADKNSVINKWTRMGVDGWRLDVADELPESFIIGLRETLAQFSQEKVLLGEVWEDASNKIAYGKRRHYVEGEELDGVMNYPLRHCILDLLSDQPSRSITAVIRELMSLRENYPRDFYFNLLNNIGTHDTERVYTALHGKIEKLRIAWELLFVLPGVPCIYYGDEAGMKGGKDPQNRGFFPWKHPNQKIFSFVKKWVQRRKNLPVLQNGELVLGTGAGCLAVIRYNQNSLGLYVVNLSAKPQKLEFANFVFAHDNNDFGEFIFTELGPQQLAPYESRFEIIKRS
ncbi:glycoside hydrolase family 13 protein [Liquorilactobacillus vini]|nr:glycoside hydrolase family 13 protein [Liquorilactobacillus vini]